MKKERTMKFVFGMFLAVVISGCATFVIGRYSTSADNTEALRTLSGIKMNVGQFNDAPNIQTASCNYKGEIRTIDGETYSSFIKKAIVSEFKTAGVYSNSAPVVISGRLDRIDNSTALDTDWTIVMTFTSSTGKSVTITEKYNYHGSVVGTADSTCGASATAFVPAVQNLVGKLIEKIPASLL